MKQISTAYNHRFQWIETAEAFGQFRGCFKVFCFYQVHLMRFQSLKRALAF